MPPTVVKHILGQAALQLGLLAAMLGPLGGELSGGDADVQRTLLFNTFVWLQLFNQVWRRGPTGPRPPKLRT